MRKKLLSIALLFFISLISQGQHFDSAAEKRISLLTRVIATELGLNEAEYLRLEALNRERVLKSDEVAALYAHDQRLQDAKMQEIEANFDRQLKTMLNPTQWAAYKVYRQVPENNLALTSPHAPDPNLR